MIDVLLTYSGYAWGILHDLAALRAVPRVKPVLLLLSVAGHAASWYRLARYSPRMRVPAPLRAGSFVVALLSSVALVYSIAVEIPFRSAWLKRGHTPDLVTTGTYALTRHPGVLGYAIAMLSWAVALRSRRMLVLAPVLIAGDVAHVAFQERVVLTRVFGDAYRDYQQETPFVIPTAQSIRRALHLGRSR